MEMSFQEYAWQIGNQTDVSVKGKDSEEKPCEHMSEWVLCRPRP